MGASVFKQEGDGNGTIAERYTVPVGYTYRLVSVSCVWAIAPTTSEDYTIEVDAVAGAQYDVRQYTVDPSATAATDVMWYPERETFLEGGDVLTIDFPGTDAQAWGTQVTWKAVP
jgi:hypothetical protein